MAASYQTFPFSSLSTIEPAPVKVDISQSTLDELKTLLKLSKLAPQTYESSQANRKYGITSEWIRDAKE